MVFLFTSNRVVVHWVVLVFERGIHCCILVALVAS